MQIYIVRDEYRILEIFSTEEEAESYVRGLGNFADKVSITPRRVKEDGETSITLPTYEFQAFHAGSRSSVNDYGTAEVSKYGENGIAINFNCSRDDGTYVGHVAFQGEHAIRLSNFIGEHVT